MTDDSQTADAHPVEVELSRKLLATAHLNAPERAVLGNRVRFSVLLNLVRQSLSEYPYFPTHLQPDSEFNGVVIEKRGDMYRTHERYESGVGKFGPIRTRTMQDLADALRFQLVSGEIDGVKIDFDR